MENKDDGCICRMCEARFRKSPEMSHDTEATSSKRKLRKYESSYEDRSDPESLRMERTEKDHTFIWRKRARTDN
jgi:hypothetical protein